VFLFSADVEFAEGTRSFSVRLFEDPETGDGYEYLISLVDARLTFDRRPNYPWYRYDNKGLERPLHLEPGVSHHLELVADGTICTLYIDGVALNARMYAKAGTSIPDQRRRRAPRDSPAGVGETGPRLARDAGLRRRGSSGHAVTAVVVHTDLDQVQQRHTEPAAGLRRPVDVEELRHQVRTRQHDDLGGLVLHHRLRERVDRVRCW